jgi:hypothetical protein
MLNPPASYVPVYAIQFIHYRKYAVYDTEVESLIVISTSDAYYVCTTVEYRDIVGSWTAKMRPPAANIPDPEKRLVQAPFLWREAKGGKEAAAKEGMQQFRVEGVDALYHEIAARCVLGRILATFTASDFLKTIPRLAAPEAGIPLGTRPNMYQTAPDTTTRTSNAPTRKGRPLPGRGGRRQLGEDHETNGAMRERKRLKVVKGFN